MKNNTTYLIIEFAINIIVAISSVRMATFVSEVHKYNFWIVLIPLLLLMMVIVAPIKLVIKKRMGAV